MNHTDNQTKGAAERSLAIVGFIALVALGMWLAIYSARFVPETVNRLGAAAVTLTSIFHRNNDGSLVVVPGDTGSSTLPFPDNGSTATPATSTKPIASGGSTGVHNPGQESSNVYQIGGTTSTSTSPYGQPDLVVSISAVGYLADTTTASFVATTTVTSAQRPAVKFVIKNIGTNVVPGGWRFSASIPAQSAYIFGSDTQQTLNPGDSIEYTLGFDQASPGVDRIISVTADSTYFVGESIENNNSASANITIRSV